MSDTSVSNNATNAIVNTKLEIGNILGLDESTHDSWDILSSVPEEGLYLVHYRPEADLSRFGELRGTIVDINARCMVCQSFGYTPTAVADQLVPNEQGVITINDTTGREHIIDLNRTTIKCGFEGTIMRVFLHNGKVYRATHRRINPVNSRWGDSVTFNVMYDQLNGPADRVMFDLTKGLYSPYVHIYLMVHPDVLSCSKQDVGPGYMVYLGVRQAYPTEPELSPYRQTPEPLSEFDNRPYSGPIDPVIGMPVGLTSIPEPIGVNGPFLLELFDWTLEQANEHLRFGFYEPFDMETELTDNRLGCGEFVMVYKYDEYGRLSGLLRVASPAYQWRSDIRDNNPNILHRLYQLTNASYIRAETVTGLDEFKGRYPLIYPFQPDTVVERIRESPRVIWTQPVVDSSVVSSKDERFYNVWICLVMSVPLHRQLDTALMYGQVISERGRIVGWLRSLYSSEKYKNDTRLLPRASAIINQALKFAEQKTSNGQNRDRYGKAMSIDQLTADNIRNLVSKEKGDSLYRLAKAMKEADASGATQE